MIKKQDKIYVLYTDAASVVRPPTEVATKDGKKVLGKHSNRRDARRQEAAIEIAKQEAKKEK